MMWRWLSRICKRRPWPGPLYPHTLGKVPRTNGGHRIYSEEHLIRLTFIQRAKGLGFYLDEIRSLLSLRAVDGEQHRLVAQITGDALARLNARISALGAMRDSLALVRSTCEREEHTGECPLLEAIAGTLFAAPRREIER